MALNLLQLHISKAEACGLEQQSITSCLDLRQHTVANRRLSSRGKAAQIAGTLLLSARLAGALQVKLPAPLGTIVAWLGGMLSSKAACTDAVSEAAHHVAHTSEDSVAHDILRSHQEVITSSIDLQAGAAFQVNRSGVERGVSRSKNSMALGGTWSAPTSPKLTNSAMSAAQEVLSGKAAMQGIADARKGHLGSVTSSIPKASIAPADAQPMRSCLADCKVQDNCLDVSLATNQCQASKGVTIPHAYNIKSICTYLYTHIHMIYAPPQSIMVIIFLTPDRERGSPCSQMHCSVRGAVQGPDKGMARVCPGCQSS